MNLGCVGAASEAGEPNRDPLLQQLSQQYTNSKIGKVQRTTTKQPQRADSVEEIEAPSPRKPRKAKSVERQLVQPARPYIPNYTKVHGPAKWSLAEKANKDLREEAPSASGTVKKTARTPKTERKDVARKRMTGKMYCHRGKHYVYETWVCPACGEHRDPAKAHLYYGPCAKRKVGDRVVSANSVAAEHCTSTKDGVEEEEVWR